MLRRARSGGFTSSYTLAHDDAFTRLRRNAAFRDELGEARRVEAATRRTLERAGIDRMLSVDPPAKSPV